MPPVSMSYRGPGKLEGALPAVKARRKLQKWMHFAAVVISNGGREGPAYEVFLMSQDICGLARSEIFIVNVNTLGRKSCPFLKFVIQLKYIIAP